MSYPEFIRKNWLKIISAIVLVALVGYFSVRLLNIDFRKSFIPPEFLEARLRGSVIAESIVGLSKESMGNLAVISSEDEIGNYDSGLNLVLKEVDRNAKARNSALELSKELAIMAENLSGVQPETATKIALQAVIDESQIVQRLINYNAYVYQLLDVLQTRFSADNTKDTSVKVKELISKMNEEAAAINELNGKYKGLMAEFDKLTASD
ncbi:MAG: hypothetical protein HYR95_02060 [Candidatus Colwellbacteria bacterium]|nr:hypothetical protein [Candidatus Colwellbacteria bacterium]